MNVHHSHPLASVIDCSWPRPRSLSGSGARIALIAIAFALIALPTRLLLAQASLPEAGQLPGRVAVVRFQGNHQLSSDELATVVSTKATGFFSNALHNITMGAAGSAYQTVDYTKLARDTAALASYYHDKGYLDARASVRVSTDTTGLRQYYEYLRQQRLMVNAQQLSPPLIEDTVTFIVHEGKPYTISHIAIEGLESLPNEFQPELTSRVTIKTGEQWSRAAAASEVDRLINILVENGYPNATEDSIVVQHTQGYHSVNVLIYFRPGNRYRYGPIHIIYDTTSQAKGRVANSVILAQLYIDTGHWYRLSEIQRSEADLNKLGTFDLFRIALDTDYINQIPDSLRDSMAVPVVVYLRMKRSSSVSLNAYVGAGSQGMIVGFGAGVTVGNFTNEADKVDAEGSWQILPSTQTRVTGSLNYTRPYIGLGHIPIIMGIGYSLATQSPTTNLPYDIESFTAHVGSNLILSHTDNNTTLSPDLLAAKVLNTINFPNDTTLAAELVSRANTPLFLHTVDSINSVDSSIRASLPHQQINLLPSVTWQDDRTNDPINPTGGNLLSTTLEVGVPAPWLFPTDTTSNYIKLVGQAKEYFDLSDNGSAIVAVHLQAGYCWFMNRDSASTYPALDHRFYSGGGASLRGWGEQQLLVSEKPTSIAYFGGYSSALFNLELRYAPFQYAQEFTSWQSLSSPIRIVLFYDAGNAWDEIMELSPSQISLGQIAQSVGIGLRYNTFFGALRIDWGFKLYDPSGNFNNSYSASTPASHGQWIFSAGPRKLSDISNIHFGIGQAF